VRKGTVAFDLASLVQLNRFQEATSQVEITYTQALAISVAPAGK
jgi:hypothetical protein